MVEDIWDSIANEQPSPEEVPLTEAQRRELEARLAAYERDPQERVSWDDAWEQIQQRTRRAECVPESSFGPKQSLTSRKRTNGMKGSNRG